MTVDLLPIINIEGKPLQIKGTIDFSDKNENGVFFKDKADITASFTVLGGSVNLSAKVSCSVEYMCDRCGELYDDTLEFEFEEILKKEAPAENQEDLSPDVIFFTGNTVSLDEIVYRNIFMALPSKKLCKEDCKGLCPVCGQNLNTGACSCTAEATDPRFDVLDNFFK